MKKQALAILSLLIIAALLVACGGGTPSSATPPASAAPASTPATDTSGAAGGSGGEKMVWATILQTNTDYNMALANNAQKICDEYGWEHNVLNAEGDIQKQIDLVQSSISQRVVGMFIHSLDDNALAEYVATAIDAGIYVYLSTTGVLDIIDQSYIDSGMLYCVDYNHVITAELCAQALADSIGGEGKVAVLAGTAGAMNTRLRTSGFEDYMAANYPDIEIVSVINCDWDQMRALSATEDILTSNPDLKGVYAMGEDMIVGAVEAVAAVGKDVKIVGIDASTRIVKMVMDGSVTAVVNCATSGSALGCVLTSHLINGEPIDNIEGVTLDGNVFGSVPLCITKENASLDLVDY